MFCPLSDVGSRGAVEARSYLHTQKLRQHSWRPEEHLATTFINNRVSSSVLDGGWNSCTDNTGFFVAAKKRGSSA